MTNYYLLLIQLLFALIGLFLFWQGIGYFRRIWQYKKLKSIPFPQAYENILQNIEHYTLLSPTYKEKIHLLILSFIENKEFIQAKITINEKIKVIIAFYASLMRLGFDFGEKDEVSSIIVYPKHFIVNHTDTLGGINHSEPLILEGQSANGTVVISWQNIEDEIARTEKENVIIHEFAHELDFEDGFADGTPVLEGSNYRSWSNVFSNVFDTLRTEVKKEKISRNIAFLGLYALKNEAEFFAVCSERFFQAPKTLKKFFPDIYEELRRFYRLDSAVIFKDLSES
jgi:Mlc titration factor MtfA (ptsG expression regulator)